VWAVALILLLAIYLAAAAYKVVPPDSVGLIERMGRLMPGVRKPGVVFIRPFIERLLVLPTKRFPLTLLSEAELLGGIPVKLTVEASCAIVDGVKFHQNVPDASPSGGSIPERVSGFLGRLLESEGRALLRDHSPAECLSDLCEVSSRLSGRLDWHTRHVGLEVYSLNITGFDLPRKEMEQVRLQAEAKRGRGDDVPPS